MSLISKSIRILGWTGEIEIIRHNIRQSNLGSDNKFVIISRLLDIKMQGLTLPYPDIPTSYWYYENSSEKLCTIFLRLLLENVSSVECIYEQHAGCERGYFKRSNGNFVALPKRDSNNQMLRIPDLIICDHNNREILLKSIIEIQYLNFLFTQFKFTKIIMIYYLIHHINRYSDNIILI